MSLRTEIAVVGAGPIGLRTAWNLARSGFDVSVFERGSEIGSPVRCAGLVSSRVLDIVGRGDYVLSRITSAKIVSPSGIMATIPSREGVFSIDRRAFDRFIAKKAADAGAEIFLRSPVKSIISSSLKVRDLEVRANYIIIAEGAEAVLSRKVGIVKKNLVLTGYEVLVTSDESNPSEVTVFLDQRLFPRFFGWAIPKGELLLVGGAGLLPGNALRSSVMEIAKRFGYRGVIGHYSGPIPMRPSLRVQRGNIFCVGDCAGQVKATTGGGIYMGLVFADALSEHIEEIHSGRSVRREYIYRRPREIREIILDYKLWRWYSSLPNDSYDRLVYFLNKNSDIIYRTVYDYHSTVLLHGMFAKGKIRIIKEVLLLLIALLNPFWR
ncbi:MAG TPA: NAD(P)/FAD-dependent oxidoreductase [Thermoprotei archaeon]|nr:NAD(P)/FAD-dependent oxidoreductase [Euryarchaeota archaeon]MCD6158320.1 NAD(P)/FAD-dependent oxidoreductase [Euryarchaeota archaeon]HDJ51003.1 NAD(P)/FAD-dependent oxidoreductase [Thermoprotei archaeon]